jgi:hypothetical protein
MSTLESPDTPKTDAPQNTEKADLKKRNRAFRHGITACKNYRKKLVREWQTNVDYRRGKPFASQSDEDRVVVNLDWSFTNLKQASLFSQVPAARVSPPPQTVANEMMPWLHSYETRVNDTLIRAGIETAMDEVLPDTINAAGFGVILLAHEAITEDVEIPAIDLGTLPPQILDIINRTGMLPNGQPVPMETVPRVIDKRYLALRLSPADFLWPLSFVGSDFDKSPWIGRSGKIMWTEAQRRWKLDPAKKRTYIGGAEKGTEETLTYDSELEAQAESEEMVSFDEVFYKTHSYDPNARFYDQIHHLVFVHGQEAPVVDEPWKGQEVRETPNGSELIGALKYPLRVLTLTYITDEAIPPSDSAVGRPQVNEIMKSRTQMILQRMHSLPIRAVDVNRVDPTVLYNLLQGKWQTMIPVQGNGQNVITEVSRSNFPQENFSFDVIANRDLERIWQIGQPITGEEVETKGEAQSIASISQTRIARERAKVGKFFCTIAEVIGGLLCLYEDPGSFGQGFDPAVSKTLSYSILADSTVLLDSNQRLKKIENFVNMYAKSGWVKLEGVLREAATLSGLDPATTIGPPEPAPPTQPNMSLRLTGTEDLMNPLALAFLMKSGQAPDLKMIEDAKKLIEQAVLPPPMDPMTGMPILPAPPDGSPDEKSPDPAPPRIGDANPSYSAMPKVNQRVLGEGEGGTQ